MDKTEDKSNQNLFAQFNNKGGRAAAKYSQINRDQNEPVYKQLASILRRQINKGELRPGDRLPSETMLAKEYQVSHMTARKAINLLAEQNLVNSFQGRGTFVKKVQLGSAAFSLHGLQEMFTDEANTSIKLIEARFVYADEKTARKLKISEGHRCIFIRRLLKVKEQPILYHCGYLIFDPSKPVVESELEVTVLKGLFSGTGSPLIKWGELEMEAILLNEEEAAVLGAFLPSSGLRLEHIFYDYYDIPLSWGWFVFRKDSLRLYTKVGLE